MHLLTYQQKALLSFSLSYHLLVIYQMYARRERGEVRCSYVDIFFFKPLRNCVCVCVYFKPLIKHGVAPVTAYCQVHNSHENGSAGDNVQTKSHWLGKELLLGKKKSKGRFLFTRNFPESAPKGQLLLARVSSSQSIRQHVSSLPPPPDSLGSLIPNKSLHPQSGPVCFTAPQFGAEWWGPFQTVLSCPTEPNHHLYAGFCFPPHSTP